LGQGACQALEDVAVLTVLLKKHPFEKAFSEYNRLRLARTHRLITQSRRFGRIAQWRNPIAVWLRNFLVKNMPEKAAERQMDSMLNVHFEPIRASSSSV
jgi:2-polyprenyl-6-methoxyphenol hydroxylase-like FAD-dependent oxidoreductase